MDEAAFKRLISGEQTGVAARVSLAGLRCLSAFYSAGIRGRNRAYDVGLTRAFRVRVPVVSVGNITAGGTGKTPLVGFLADWFSQRSVRCCLLSRGYRALPNDDNDEKRMLDRLCPGVPHLQNPDRVHAAKEAITEHNAGLLILDDGFQHRRLCRDLDIVLIDATCPFGHGAILPRGLLREPLASLQRADCVILTRADQVTAPERDAILKIIADHTAARAIAEVAFRPGELVAADGSCSARTTIDPGRVAAFCGLGNPDAFRATLTSVGLQPHAFRAFPDHHHYTSEDLADLQQWLHEQECHTVLTTEKDLVKIPHDRIGDVPLRAVRIRPEFLRGRDTFEACLERVLEQSINVTTQ